VYRWPTRLLTGALAALSWVSLPLAFLILLQWNEPPLLHARLLFGARLILVLGVAPYLAARTLRGLCTARLRYEADALVVSGRFLRVEIPRTAIERIRPWHLPLPGPGVWLVLRSGRRFGYALEPHRTAALSAFDPALAAPALAHPTLAYAAAREQVTWRWYHVLVKFVAFPLIPGLLVFRLHQYILYGGPLGQYYLSGLRPYLETFAIMQGRTSMDCLLWASLWRAGAELLAFAAAWLAPRRAGAVRRAAEIVCTLGYYGGIVALIVIAFLR
jgi:hypothetical protein